MDPLATLGLLGGEVGAGPIDSVWTRIMPMMKQSNL